MNVNVEDVGAPRKPEAAFKCEDFIAPVLTFP
jgi:hypothetical protein